MEKQAIIELENVSYTYAGADKPALDGIDLSIKAGEFVLLTGESGCGKTTLTRLVNGLALHFYEGELTGKVFIGGRDAAGMQLHEIGDVAGSVFQDPRSQFFTTNTTSETAFSCENAGMPQEEIQRRVSQSAQVFSIEGLMDKDIFALSSGEKQCVAIASVHAFSPPVLVLDEPSANLDEAATEKLRRILESLKEKGCTVIVSEHRIHYLRELAETVLVLREGRVQTRYSGGQFRTLTNANAEAAGLRCLFPNELTVAETCFPTQEQAALELERISYAYPGYEDVLDKLSFRAHRGEIIGIIGHNGAGKTSLMEVICGVSDEQGGVIRLGGKRALPKDRVRSTYYVMQDADYQLFCESVENELLLGGKKDAILGQKADDLLSALDLQEFRERHPGSLSGGQKQRVSIALSGMKDADILCFDEPTSGLDLANMRRCAQLLRGLAQQGKTVLVVTHDTEFLLNTCNRALRVENGVIADDFTLTNDNLYRLRQKEKSELGSVAMERKKKPGIGRLMELAGEKKGLMTMSGIVATLSVFLQLVPLLAVYFIMTELLQNAASPATIDGALLTRWALIGLGGMVGGHICMYVGGMCSHVAAFRILYGVRAKLAEHLGRLPLGYFNKNSAGKIKTVIEQDAERIEGFIAHHLPDMVSAAVMFLAMAVTMFVLDPLLAVASLIPIILGYIAQFSMMMGKQARASMVEYFNAQASINASSLQYVKGMPSIKVFGQTVHSFRKFYADMVRYRDFCVEYTDHFQFGFVTFRVLLVSICTFILPVGLFLFSGQPENVAFAAVLLFFLILAPGITTPVIKLNNLAASMRMIMEGASRVDKILAEQPIAEEATGAKPRGSEIRFDSVRFSYTGKVDVLHDISFAAKQGEITALVGPSGSGKSTIAQLIPRFWDVNEGGISIGGVDIREMGLNDLMGQMSFVFQDSFLFSDTIYQNILIGKPNASREEVEAAAKAARCHDFISAMPQGYDTRVGAGGVYLSGGEEQRVSVARAILKNAPILVLDEATAYADPENEYEMQQALSKLIKDKTVIIIAHRLATIQNASQILVLKDGRIAQRGTHNELAKEPGLYKNMWDAYTEADTWEIDWKEAAI